jgi:hypothetical protein
LQGCAVRLAALRLGRVGEAALFFVFLEFHGGCISIC